VFSCPSAAVGFVLNFFHPENSLCLSAPGIFNYTTVQYVRGAVEYPEL